MLCSLCKAATVVALYRRFRGGFHSALRRIPQLNNWNSAVRLVAFLRHPS
jgi:hypothetical protein